MPKEFLSVSSSSDSLLVSFDVDEEAMLWIPHRGENGIPNSICALVDDAEWKLQSLKFFALTVMELTAEIKRGEVQ